jgi:DNA-binding NarL/FixJ family response regulator
MKPEREHEQQSGKAALLCSSSGPDWEDLLSVLNGLNIEVRSTASAREAAQILRGASYSLIFMDLDDEAEWKSSIQALHNLAPSAGVLAYSRKPEERIWLDVLEAGGFDLLCRTSRKPEIQWIVESALKMRQPHSHAKPSPGP